MNKWATETLVRKQIKRTSFASIGRLRELTITLPMRKGKERISINEGDVVPPGWHSGLFFRELSSENGLSSDGYSSEYCPPSPFDKRRLWGGSFVEFDIRNPIIAGQKIFLDCRATDISFKKGRNGDDDDATKMIVVTEQRDISNENGISIKEQVRLVYLHQDHDPLIHHPAKKATHLPDPDFSWVVSPSPVMLFRYSAVTFNAHKIHYDHNYAIREGFSGCLIHAPFTALMLLDLLLHEKPHARISKFDYKALSPLVVDSRVALCAKISDSDPTKCSLWAVSQKGVLALQGHCFFSI